MIVLDSSAIIEILLDSPKAPIAAGLYRSQQSHAPELVGFEVLSAVRGKVRGKELTPDQAVRTMLDFEGIEGNLELWPLIDVMTERAIEWRDNVSAYDATYVTLAEILPCPLVTADAKLGRAVEGLIDVIVV